MKLPFFKNSLPKISCEDAKIFGTATGIALAMALFAVIAANVLYQPKKILKRGFEIEVSAENKAAKKEEKPVDLAAMMRSADAMRGEKIFKKCSSCHNVNRGESAKVGPNLFGIAGRSRGAVAGFSYSAAMKAKGGSWDRASLDSFIAKPKDFLPGTKMAFPGLKKPQDRADVILFLEGKK